MNKVGAWASALILLKRELTSPGRAGVLQGGGSALHGGGWRRRRPGRGGAGVSQASACLSLACDPWGAALAAAAQTEAAQLLPG